ncbi:hypothetical protein ACFE04_020666 [Oxalis oulophora]
MKEKRRKNEQNSVNVIVEPSLAECSLESVNTVTSYSSRVLMIPCLLEAFLSLTDSSPTLSLDLAFERLINAASDVVGLQGIKMLKTRAVLNEKLKQTRVFSSVSKKVDKGQKHRKLVNSKISFFMEYSVNLCDNFTLFSLPLFQAGYGRENVAAWICFYDRKDLFKEFLGRVIRLKQGRELTISEKTNYLLFMINALHAGRERYSTFCTLQKYVDLHSLAIELNIVSASTLERWLGFIFIEADKECDIIEAGRERYSTFCPLQKYVDSHSLKLLLFLAS